MDNLKKLLDKASQEKRKPLVGLIDSVYTPTSSSDDIIKGIKWLHRNLLEDFWRDVFGSQETYTDVLLSICKHLDIKESSNQSPVHLEQLIGQKVMLSVWGKMTTEQRKNFNAEIEKMASKHGKSTEWIKAGGLGAVIVAGELGGFSTYLLATSSLATLTGALGVTLPFVAYTSLTSALSLILGPVGWIGAGLYAVMKISGTNYKKLIPVVLYISALRNEPKY